MLKRLLLERGGRGWRWSLCFLLAALGGYGARGVHAQDYSLQTGAPAFRAPQPVKLGFVNLANGNLHLEIPLAGTPPRGGLLYFAKLVYDSRIWQAVSTGTSASWQPTNVPNSWGGWRFVASREGGSVNTNYATDVCGLNDYPVRTWGPFVWTEPNGTQHTFPIYTYTNLCTHTSVSSGNAFASDSTGYHMYVTNYSTATVYASDGRLVYPGLQGEDTNGNYFTADSNGNIIDTLGRTPVTVISNCNNNASQTCYNILNSQGTTSTVTVTTQSVNVNTNFRQSGATEYSGTLTVIQSIKLPDGTSYSFSYDSGTTAGNYSELTGITLPTGGAISYSWTTFQDANGNSNRWVNSYSMGGGTWTFTPAVVATCAPTNNGCVQTVTVTKPNGASGDQALYTFTLNNGAWMTKAQHYTGSTSTGTLLKTVTATWNFSNSCPTTGCTGSAYIQMVSETTAFPVPNGSSISRTTQWTYDSTQDMNVTQISKWKFYTGSLPASADQVTSIIYLTGTAYTNANIINRPTSITVKDGSGNLLAQTNISYDSTSLVSITGTTHHNDTNYGTGYTTRGNPTQIQRCAAISSSSCTSYATATLNYDTTGQVVSVQDPNGNITNLSYADNYFNDSGQPPSAYTPPAPTNAYLTKMTLPITGSLQFGYYYGTGKRAFATDQNSASTYTHFLDSLDRLTNIYLPAGGWTLTTYASETQADTYTGIGTTSASTSCSSCRHDEVLLDSWGRPQDSILVSDPQGTTTVATSYDPAGRVASVTNPYRGTSDSTYGADSYAYDRLDEVTSVTHADNTKASTYYGAQVTNAGGIGTQSCPSSTYGLGYPILSVDEAGLRREVWTNGFGRTIEMDEPNSSGNLNVATCYVYDALGNLTQVVQDYGQTVSQTRSYAYDGLSRVTSVTTPEGGVLSYSYDGDGNVMSQVAPKPNQTSSSTTVTTSYTYDALNRVKSKSYSDGTPTVNYYYDQSSYNGLTIRNGLGRLTGMSDSSGQTAWSYDAAGRIVTEQRTIAGVTKIISYSYNLDGSLASVTYPSGRTVSYTISNAARAISAVDSANAINYVTSGTYAPQGAMASIMHGQTSGGFAGITESYTYNNRLEWSTAQASSSNGTVINWAYSFAQSTGNNGSVASITNNLDTGRTESFSYDPLNRILTAQAQATSGQDCWGQAFGSGGLADDPLGNLLSISVTKCSAPSLSVSVNGNSQISNAGFSYDAAGDMTADGQFTYTYDAENRITSSSAGVSYTYDGNSLRVKKSSGTLYWRAFTGNVLTETDASGNTTKEYIYFAGRQIAWRNSAGNVYYEFADHLGSTRVVTDSTGHTCFDTDYYPYGQENDHTASCPPTNRFTGYEFDSETGNYYAFFRYYSPRLGRFMTTDPLGAGTGNPQSLNRYSYVMNNPGKFIDPLGLHCGEGDDMTACTDGGGGAGGGGGFFGGGGLECTLDGGFASCSLALGLVGEGAAGILPPGVSATGAINGHIYQITLPFDQVDQFSISYPGLTAAQIETLGLPTALDQGSLSSGSQAPGGGDGGGPQKPQKPCPPSGHAPPPGFYAQLGKSAGWIENDVYLFSFHRGGFLDAQVRYGGSQAYANYVFGVYMSAVGYSLSTALSAANAYGAVASNYPPGTRMDQNYTHIPAANVANITNGYNAEQTGTLCNPYQ